MQRALLFIIAPVFLAACATSKPPVATNDATANITKPTTSSTSQKNAAITPDAITAWNLSGAIAAKTPKKAWTASLHWAQKGPQYYHIRLLGPMGGGGMTIEAHGENVTYREGSKHLTSNNAETLLQQQTGVRLPVHDLYYWVRGLPAPGSSPTIHRNNAGDIIEIKQGGYTIQYGGYSHVNGIALPNKIHLQGSNVMIKLIIKQWGI